MHPGPMNRGVEIDPRVADSDAGLVIDQVRAGLVVRMAVLYDLLVSGPVPVETAVEVGMSASAGRSGKTGVDDVVIRGARVLDPREGVDAILDVRIDNGTITQLGSDVDANGHRIIDGSGLVLAPAFVDPHVHLRTPGRERGDDRDRDGGGRSRRLLRDPRHAEHRPDRRRSRRAARAPRARRARGRGAGRFFAAITKEQQGVELTEMGELADAGAVGFTDDGRPVVAAGVMRRALQYSTITRRAIAVHCEEPTLTHGGHAHGGLVAAELGLGPWPSLGESLMVARDLALAGEVGRPIHLMHLSARQSVDHLRSARSGRAGVGRGHAASPLPDRRGGADARPEREDEPAAPHRGRPERAARSAARRDDLGDRHRPRATFA